MCKKGATGLSKSPEDLEGNSIKNGALNRKQPQSTGKEVRMGDIRTVS